MITVSPDGGGITVAAPRYRLRVSSDGTVAHLCSPDGDRWCALSLLASVDRPGERDETIGVRPPRQAAGEEPVITVERTSTCWNQAELRLACRPDSVEVTVAVEGRGRLGEVHLLGGRSAMAGGPTGFLPSGSAFTRLFSPSPADPRRVLHRSRDTAEVGVQADARPGRGHWFFTPAPLCWSLTRAEEVPDPGVAVAGGWLSLGLVAPVEALAFPQATYRGTDGGFSLHLDYEGHTGVDGWFSPPSVVVSPGLPTPYEGLRRYREILVERGMAPGAPAGERPGWWGGAMFCGWGAQCYLARGSGGSPAALSTQASYDRFLAELGSHGIVPPTIVIDDKWQLRYGKAEPDPEKWPDLAGWIARRHRDGQHVLLWWAPWETEGLDPAGCVRNPAGQPVAADPTEPRTRRTLAAQIEAMLSPAGLDADGLKVDLTGRTPSGASLTRYGHAWGIALLHDLLTVIYRAAKAAKPDALVITHTPHPSFTDVTDMIRLNDMLRLDDPEPLAPVLPQMRYRAAVVTASCPGLLVDTDDWCQPDLRTWREYLAVKPSLGVPSLYYATHLDLTGEALEPADYDALRKIYGPGSRSRGIHPGTTQPAAGAAGGEGEEVHRG
jgi:hypothetical protein